MRSLVFAVFALVAFCVDGLAQEPSHNHVIIALRLARTTPAPGYLPHESADTTFYVNDSILVSDPDIEDAQVDQWQGELIIHIRMTKHGAKRLADGTRKHVGGRLAVFLDQQFAGAPVIVDAISGPTTEIEGAPPLPQRNRIVAAIAARWPTHH